MLNNFYNTFPTEANPLSKSNRIIKRSKNRPISHQKLHSLKIKCFKTEVEIMNIRLKDMIQILKFITILTFSKKVI
jgi:hypothetical protein